MKQLISVMTAALAVTLGSVASANASSRFTPVKLRSGMKTPAVAVLQQYLRLNTHGNFYQARNGYDGIFGPGTEAGLKKWQRREGYNPTGWITIGSSQWNRLRHEEMEFRLPDYLDPQAVGAARQNGWAVDASKSPGMVNVLHFDARKRKMTATLSIAASYGGFIDGKDRPSTNGVFHIFAEHGPDYTAHVPGKPWDGAPMPYATCYNGGECLHEDGLFVSHGCIHIPSYDAARYINGLPLGTTVVVHE